MHLQFLLIDELHNLQLEVFHPILMRSYMRKFDMDEPPVLEESLENVENVDGDGKKEEINAEEAKLEEKYYR